MTEQLSSRYMMTTSNETDEQSRLDLQHRIWLLALNGHLHTSPLVPTIKTILDIGCGTGTWALSMAKAHPQATITATDITTPNIAPSILETNPNFHFIQFNANSTSWPLPSSSTFDFIHGRMIISGIHDWPAFLFKCYHYLSPGGRLELLDVSHPFRANNPGADSPETSAFIRFGHAAEQAWMAAGIDYRVTKKHVHRLTQLGFEGVETETVRWPLGEWAETEREKEIGRLNWGNFLHFIRTAGVSVLSSGLEKKQGTGEVDARKMEEMKILVDEAVLDLENKWSVNQFFLEMKIHRARKGQSAGR